jgi:hypothetical protein
MIEPLESLKREITTDDIDYTDYTDVIDDDRLSVFISTICG